MKVFHYEIIFLSVWILHQLASSNKDIVFLRQLFISSAGFGGNAVAVGDISCLVLHKWFGDRMAIFGLLQFWPDFDFYLLSILRAPTELISLQLLPYPEALSKILIQKQIWFSEQQCCLQISHGRFEALNYSFLEAHLLLLLISYQILHQH